MLSASSCANCCAFKKCFAGFLTKEELEIFAKSVTVEEFQKGDILWRVGKPALAVYLIVEGNAFLEHEGNSNNPIIVRNVREMECVGLEAMVDGGTYLSTVRAKSSLITCKFNNQLLRKFLNNNKMLFNKMLNEMYLEKKMLFNYLIVMNSGKPASRLAYVLLNLGNNEGEVLATKEEMAQMARLQRETVSRILKKLKDSDILELHNRVIRIKRRKELEALISVVNGL